MLRTTSTTTTRTATACSPKRIPNPAALLRLATCVLIESHDEWQVAERRYLSEGSMAQLTPPAPTAITGNNPRTGGDRHRHHPHGIVQTRLNKPQSITRNELHHIAGLDRARHERADP